MTTRSEKLERIEAAGDAISLQTYEDLAQQSKIVTVNLLTGFGDKACFSGTGFALSIQETHRAALTWLLAEGYVELTDKAKATTDELAERRAARASQSEQVDSPIGFTESGHGYL